LLNVVVVAVGKGCLCTLIVAAGKSWPSKWTVSPRCSAPWSDSIFNSDGTDLSLLSPIDSNDPILTATVQMGQPRTENHQRGERERSRERTRLRLDLCRQCREVTGKRIWRLTGGRRDSLLPDLCG
jgi:hypothetical protein